MRSMTGFGKGYAANAELGIAFNIEISSVNRKQLEIRVNMPHEISAFELLLRQLIKQKITRGTVMARVTMNLDEKQNLSTVTINHSLLEYLAKECSELQEKFGNQASWSIAELMNVQGVMEIIPPDTENTEIKTIFVQAVEAAVNNLVGMRETEGQELCNDLKKRSKMLIALTDKLEPLIAKVPEVLKQKLFERLEKEDFPIDINDDRMLKELIFYVDRSDVSEELTRLRSHFVQLEQFLSKNGKAVGRSMDFLLQEIFREVTTFGNKAAGCEVTPVIVEFKTELEKIREQIQNVE
jgi:uncharacterized protein (TIGR00255 family)